MIRLGLRLAVAGGREAITRLVIIGSAVALGVGLLLAVLAGINAVDAQNARYGWLSTGQPAAEQAADGTTGRDPLWWSLRRDFYDAREIGRVDVAATGPDSPVPPGIPRLPGPGEYYASPALHELLASAPAAELADRFPGREIGTIGRAALPDPTTLLVIVGHSPEELAAVPGAEKVTTIGTTPPGTFADALKLILSVVAAGLLFPVLIFIGVATRLSAARREQRFAAMRLVGATPRQVSVLSAVESTVAAVAGTAVGFGLFFAFRRPLAAVPFTGAPFYSEDFRLTVAGVLLVALGVPAAAAIAARIALRRVRISPLGVARRVAPRPPRAYRLIPLLVGLAELAYFVDRRPRTTDGQVAAFLSGILLIMAGLVIAGPWLTMVGARLMARRSSRPATLIAARRLGDNPQAGFRAVSGLVLALFVTSVAIGVITTIVAHRGPQGRDTAAGTTLTMPLDGPAAPATTSVPPTVSGLTSAPGVRSVTPVRANPADSRGRDHLPGLVSCADLARAAVLGRCADGAAVAEVWYDIIGPESTYGGTWHGPTTTWATAALAPEQLQRLPILSVVVDTDGSASALERARTVLELAYPWSRIPPSTEDDANAGNARTLAGWRQLAYVVILASLPIAACSLAVSIVGGLNERRRPFGLLRLSGVPLRVLRRVVALESAVPLLVAAVVAIGIGFLAAHLFLTAQLDYALRPPGARYYLIVLVGLGASLGIIASTLPLLRRMTGPETVRNE